MGESPTPWWHVDTELPARLGVDRQADRDVFGRYRLSISVGPLMPLSAATRGSPTRRNRRTGP